MRLSSRSMTLSSPTPGSAGRPESADVAVLLHDGQRWMRRTWTVRPVSITLSHRLHAARPEAEVPGVLPPGDELPEEGPQQARRRAGRARGDLRAGGEPAEEHVQGADGVGRRRLRPSAS